MSEELQNEIEAINSIYGDGTLIKTREQSVLLLSPPDQQIAIRLSFPPSYPVEPPLVAGSESPSGSRVYASKVLHTTQKVLEETFVPGSVCVFGLIEELQTTLAGDLADAHPQLKTQKPQVVESEPVQNTFPSPVWILSQPVTEKKSTFIARVCNIQSLDAVRAAVASLLATDKKAAKATHNITAYRIRDSEKPAITFQDCDDGGESAAAGRLLHLLQIMDAWNCLVVVSRWYGGVKLGPDRFRIINQTAREAVVSWQNSGTEKGKK